ncbi:hypothetical protein HUW62_12495 [Myxococcus sp. AM011]|uniref:hypothetical protein n=1 Tax=Myxococcus sp. AM011 TaxID=2745200 RepID=UPI001595D078|nr:hypothetical protein [Myxococcus sp. AM011]NVJ22038.1 hypothetical protein [Myxococcus sp. AM011]
MLKVDIVNPEPPDELGIEQRCGEFLHIRVRVVECCLHRGVAGIKVSLRLGAKTVGPFDTDKHGRVTFGVPRARVLAPMVAPQTFEVGFQLPAGGQYFYHEEVEPWTAVPMTPGKNSRVQLTLASNWVTPPEDLDPRVKAVLSNADIRIYVDDGANNGNQAACLDLLRAIDRIERTAATTPDPKPLVRVLANSHTEFEKYEHSIAMNLPDASKNTPASRKAFWAAYLPAVIEGLLEVKAREDSGEEKQGYFLDGTGMSATIRLLRPCARQAVVATDVEDAADAADDVNHFQTTQLHLKYVLKGMLNHASVVALAPDKVSISNEVAKKTILVATGGNLSLKLTVLSCEEVSPAARLRKLEPNLANVRAATQSLATKEDFTANARANRIGILPAFDIGVSLPQPERAKLNELAAMMKVTDQFVLQPFLWKPTTRHLRRDDATFERLCLPEQASYVYDVAALGDADTANLASENLRGFFTALLAAKQRGDARLHIGYGVHQAAAPATVGKNLATALARLAAQKKLITVVPCKLPAFGEGAAQVVGTHVINLDVADPTSLASLQGALANAAVKVILVTTAGALPTALFRQLVLHSQLPVLFEGANTASLLLNAGRPHLSVKLGTTTYATLPGSDAPAKLAALTGLLVKNGLAGDELDRLATFLDKAQAGTSEVGDYFTEAQTFIKQDKLDQLKLALYRLDHQRRLVAGTVVEADALPPPKEIPGLYA